MPPTMVNSAFDLTGPVPIVELIDTLLRVSENPLCDPHDRGRAESLAQRAKDAKRGARTEE